MFFRLVWVGLLLICSFSKTSENLDEKWAKLTFSDKVIMLRDVAVESKQLLEKPQTASTALSYYNFLRAKADRTLASSVKEIDTQWLTHFERKFTVWASVEYSLKNNCKKALLMLPTESQEALLHEAVRDLEIKDQLVPIGLAYEGGTAYSKYGTFTKIGIGSDPDLHVRTAIVYHELGHVFYKDSDVYRTQEDIEAYIQTDYFKGYSTKVCHLIQKGASLLPSIASTTLGSNVAKKCDTFVNELIQTQGFLWIGPHSSKLEVYRKHFPQEYAVALYERFKEQRADLFSYQKLYENNKFAALFAKFHAFSLGQDVVQQGKGSHPSHLERVLYGLGYLAEQGVDLPKAIKAWESQGECVDAETLTCKDGCAHALRQPGALDALAVYYALSTKDYVQWKKTIRIPSRQKMLSAISLLKKSLERSSSGKCRETLYWYNLVRDLNNQPGEHFLEAIDHTWIDTIEEEIVRRTVLSLGGAGLGVLSFGIGVWGVAQLLALMAPKIRIFQVASHTKN